MDFMTSVKTCLSKYATFSGRGIRSEFWWFILFCIIGGMVLGAIDAMIFGYGSVGIFALIFQLGTLSHLWQQAHVACTTLVNLVGGSC